MKKALSLLLAALILLSACSALAEAAKPIVFTAATTTTMGSLYPFGINHGTKQAIRGVLFEPLFWKDYDGQLYGILAKGYEDKGDGVYEIELFDYIYDSAGNHLTAADVIFSIDLWIADGKGSQNYGTLTSYEQIDDYKIRLTFANEKMGAFDKCVTYCYCVTKAAWEASADQMYATPVGTGRYVLKDMVAESWYEFAKRDDYWQTNEEYICDKNAGRVDTFVVRIVADATTLAVALEKGEIDFATKEITETDKPNFVGPDGKALPGYSVAQYGTTANAHITFNCSPNSLCSDVNLRKAIATCIDAVAIAQNVQGVYGKVGTSCLVPTVYDADEALNAEEDYFTVDYENAYDASMAKVEAYLKAANYHGETLKLLVKPNTWTWDSAVLIEAYCAMAGINIKLEEPENAQYNTMRTDETGTQYDMDLAGMSTSDGYAWKALTDLDATGSNTGVSRIMVADEKLQALYDAAAQKATNSLETVNELVKYVDEQCYFYNIFYYDLTFIGNDRIQNMVIDANLECIFSAFTVTP
ncbi:MAG: ABC transporter substrate-binding protein [Clostridia bacterium]|nr:ABC transporter substrate-binding protein [Clostridia bacterium]